MDQSLIENAKKKAGYAAVDEFINGDMVIGVGSGSTVGYAIERLAQRVKQEHLKIICIPTSFQTLHLISDYGMSLGDLSQFPSLELVIDGADEVDTNLNLIKGGGACLTQEKIVASNAKKLIVVADYRKESKTLGEKWKNGVPIEVIPMAYVPIMKKLEKLGGKPKLRMGINKLGPVISDNGHFIIDVDFGLIQDPRSLDNKLQLIPGIVETGLFIDLAVKAFFGQEDGSITVRTK